jgi:hypothetical protein
MNERIISLVFFLLDATKINVKERKAHCLNGHWPLLSSWPYSSLVGWLFAFTRNTIAGLFQAFLMTRF